MSAAYREDPRPRSVVVGRLRVSPPLLALAVAAVAFAATFAITARITVTCKRVPLVMGDRVSCRVTQDDGFRSHIRNLTFVSPKESRVEGTKIVVPTDVGELVLLDAPLSREELTRIGDNTIDQVRARHADHALEHGGGSVADVRVVSTGLVLAAIFALLSLRRRRIVIDHDAETLVASTSIALLPWHARRATLRRVDRAVAERDDRGGRLVVESTRGRVVVLEGADAEVDELAQRVVAEVSRAFVSRA